MPTKHDWPKGHPTLHDCVCVIVSEPLQLADSQTSTWQVRARVPGPHSKPSEIQGPHEPQVVPPHSSPSVSRLQACVWDSERLPEQVPFEHSGVVHVRLRVPVSSHVPA